MNLVHHSHPSVASLGGSLHCIVDFKSACFFALFMLLTQISNLANQCTSYFLGKLHSLQGPCLKLMATLKYDCMYGIHAQKRSPKLPRTHLTACKISKFSSGMTPDPLLQSILWVPLFVIALDPLQYSWWP